MHQVSECQYNTSNSGNGCDKKKARRSKHLELRSLVPKIHIFIYFYLKEDLYNLFMRTPCKWFLNRLAVLSGPSLPELSFCWFLPWDLWLLMSVMQVCVVVVVLFSLTLSPFLSLNVGGCSASQMIPARALNLVCFGMITSWPPSFCVFESVRTCIFHLELSICSLNLIFGTCLVFVKIARRTLVRLLIYRNNSAIYI